MCPAPPGNERECGAVKARASAAVDGCVVRVSMTEVQRSLVFLIEADYHDTSSQTRFFCIDILLR
jgi:hypothetical protein